MSDNGQTADMSIFFTQKPKKIEYWNHSNVTPKKATIKCNVDLIYIRPKHITVLSCLVNGLRVLIEWIFYSINKRIFSSMNLLN